MRNLSGSPINAQGWDAQLLCSGQFFTTGDDPWFQRLRIANNLYDGVIAIAQEALDHTDFDDA